MSGTGYIYLIVNQVNGKKYVGQTTSTAERRWKQYCTEVKYRPMRHVITRAMAKYGIQNFNIIVLEIVVATDLLSELNRLEPFYIALYNSISPNGYNLEAGGKNKGSLHSTTKAKLREINKGRKPPQMPWTTERRTRISQLKKGNTYSLGRKHSDEAKAKMSAARTGIPLSLEHRAKLRTAHLNQPKVFGRPVSPETRAKIRAKLKGRNVRKEKLEQGQRDNSCA